MGTRSSKVLSVREAEDRCTPEELERYRRGFDKLSALPAARKAPRPHPISRFNVSRNPMSMSNLSSLMPAVSVSSVTSTLFPSRPEPQLDKRTFINDVLGGSFPPQLASRIFQCFDNRSSGYLKYSDFIRGMAILGHGTIEEKCDLVFQIYDIQRTGYVTEQDMMRIFREDMLGPSSLQAVTELVTACFEKYDEQKEGKITYAQLKQWAEENKDVTALTSWMLDDRSFMPQQEEVPQHKEASFDESLLSSADKRRVDLRSAKSLSEFTHFDEKEVNDLERIFREIKKRTPNGRLDREALGVIFSTYPGMKALPGPLIDRLYYAFDDDMVGYIESREFVCGLSLLCRGDESRKLKFWFEVFDVDKDNMLSKAEMLALVSSLWKVQALKSEMDGEDELRLSTSAATLMTASAELKVLEAENKRMEKVVEAAFRDMGIECGGEEEPHITFEQFQEWFSKNEIALQFLDTITRLSNIVLGVRPTDRREEARIVVDLMNQTSRLRAHDLVYVLSNEWWQQWKEFTSYEHVLTGVEDDVVEEAEQGPIGTVQPGPITNTTLTVVTVKGKMQTTALKQNLVPQSDYIIVPEKVWNVLWNWYGGGPMLAREMVMQGEGDNAELLPELYPYTLHVLLRRLPGGPPSKMCEITISKLKTVGELKEEACSRMMIPESAEVRLWDAYEESAPKMLADEAESLSQAKLVPDQKVILEMQTEGGLWPLSETVSVKARGVAPQPGQVGLHNLGNTCFMNSALQCLSHTVPLRNYFLEGLWKRDLNRRSRDGARGELAKSYAQLLELLWIGKNNSVPSTVAPRSFKRTIGKFAPRFSGYQQHDAHELLGVLVDGLHEDLNRIRRKKYFEFPDSGGRPDAEVALECWEGLRQNRDESCIVDLMYGQLCSKTVCDTCGNVSTHFDMFNCLQLPLPQETMTMIEVCVHYLNGVEVRKYGVRVPNNSILVDVGKELAKICPLPLTRMAYCDVRNSYFATHFTKYVNISKVRSLHVYEYATDPAAVSVWVGDSANACDESGSSEAADTPVRAEPQATLPPPVKSPKSSRKESSKSKKRKGAYVHVEVIMRYLERLDVYFLTPNKPHVFGTPLLLSIELARLERMSLEDLYTLVAVRAGPVLTLVEEKEGISRFPFRLSQVNRSGQSCASCGWNQFCVGCEFDDLEKLRANGITLAADFPQATMPLYYNIAISKDISVDDSVAENRALQNKPITLDECFSEFAKVETLRGDEAVYCSKCTEMRDSQKKMDLFRIPSVLMVQLKRFNQRSQFLTKNGKLVSLPLTLDLSPWVPEHLAGEVEYELYAVLNHFGSLAGGHYVAYAKHSADGRWYCYDDRRCSEIEEDKVVTKNAYVLFYGKKGLEGWTWPDLPPPVDDGDEEAGHCRFM